jgi:DNA-binding FrmR family transcriptional regulator
MKDYKRKTSITLKKANSLTAKVIKMLKEDKYCIDIIQQNLAIIGLLKSANLDLLQGHLGSCVKNAIKEKDEEKLNEMMQELLKVMRTAQNK